MSRVMSRRAIASALGTLMVATAVSQIQAPAAQAKSQPSSPGQWRMQFSGLTRANVPFALYNEREGDYLHHKARPYGTDLKFRPFAKNEWKFVRCYGGNFSPVRYDQSLALYNKSTNRYMIYRGWPWGNSLGWSKVLKQSDCQWKVRGGKAGATAGLSPVRNAMLFNTKKKDYLVNAWRKGVDLRWYKSTHCADHMTLKKLEKAMGYYPLSS